MSEDPTTTATAVDAALRDVLAPVREQFDQLEQMIATREQELAELRKTRTRVRHVLNALDPQEKKATRPQASGSGRPKAAPETVEQIDAWIREHVHDGETFSGPELMKNGYDLTSSATLSAALVQLQDQGRIRLDSVGGPGSTMRKNFKLVSS